MTWVARALITALQPPVMTVYSTTYGSGNAHSLCLALGWPPPPLHAVLLTTGMIRFWSGRGFRVIETGSMFWCNGAIVKKPAVISYWIQDIPGLCSQYSATELWQLDNHQPSQSSICTAQVVLNTSVTTLAATQYVPSEPYQGWSWLENSLH